MAHIVVALVFFLLAFCGMAIGVIISDRRLKGSCGGMSAVLGEEGNSCPCGRKEPCS